MIICSPILTLAQTPSFVKSQRLLFRFTAVGGFVPLKAIITVGGRRPGGPWWVHSQPLEASALGAYANVAATTCHNGRLLGQFVGEWLCQSHACAQPAVAETGPCGPSTSVLRGERMRTQSAGTTTTSPSQLQAVLTQHDALQLPQHLLTH